MWQAQDVIVVSDLHLSADETGQGLFQADEALEEFLTWIFKERSNSVLVLNGDFLDYLFIERPPDFRSAFDPNTLSQQTDSILRRNAGVMRALGKLACSSRHSVVIMGGNHDSELIFPVVQERIEAALSHSKRRPYVKWLVNGEALPLQVGGVKALIEHGNILDDWNDVDHDKLRSAVSLATRGLVSHHKYQPPPGSKLVTEHLSTLRKEYPWVELMKPEREAAFPLLSYLTTLRYKSGFAGALNLYARMVTKTKITALREELDPAVRFRKETERELSTGSRIKRMIQEISTSREAHKRADLIKQLKKVARRDGFFDVSTPEKNITRDLKFLLRGEANLLVHGHTHSAKAYRVGSGMYFNSGTWARMLKLPDDDADSQEWDQFLDDIEKKNYQAFERPTYVCISSGKNETSSATLHEWPKSETLAAWVYADNTWKSAKEG